jgi:hypothetical protein
MAVYRIDPAKSSLRVETRAKGMLAKLAHDLSIEGPGPTGTCTIEDGRFTLEMELPVAALRVAGVRKGDRVDTTVLSRSDLDDIHGKLRSEVLAGRSTIGVRATGSAPDGARGVVRAEVTVQAGRGEQRQGVQVTVTEEGDRRIATGSTTVSLEALRIPPVKGPLGAFRVDDAIAISARLELTVELPSAAPAP